MDAGFRVGALLLDYFAFHRVGFCAFSFSILISKLYVFFSVTGVGESVNDVLVYCNKIAKMR